MGDEANQQIASLSERAASGSEQAFRELVEKTHPIVYRVALRLTRSEPDADDTVQETFLRAWEGLPSVRNHQATIGWLCGIARNVAHDRFRRRKRRPTESLDAPAKEGMRSLVETIASEDEDPEQQLGTSQLGQALEAAMDRLKEKHRVVLALREIDGMSYEEIAEALDCSVGTVESRLHRARKALARVVKSLARELDKEIPI